MRVVLPRLQTRIEGLKGSDLPFDSCLMDCNSRPKPQASLTRTSKCALQAHIGSDRAARISFDPHLQSEKHVPSNQP